MKRVIVYSLLLIAGMGFSQFGFAEAWPEVIAALTMILLAYIMIEVGMEFDIDKSHLGQSGADAPGGQESMAIAALSLALNLALTGFFILVVIKLLKRPG